MLLGGDCPLLSACGTVHLLTQVYADCTAKFMLTQYRRIREAEKYFPIGFQIFAFHLTRVCADSLIPQSLTQDQGYRRTYSIHSSFSPLSINKDDFDCILI